MGEWCVVRVVADCWLAACLVAVGPTQRLKTTTALALPTRRCPLPVAGQVSCVDLRPEGRLVSSASCCSARGALCTPVRCVCSRSSMEPEPEPQSGQVKVSKQQKIEGVVKAKLKDHAETSEMGLSGPTLKGQVCGFLRQVW